ncbi:MAG: hypothetical protein HQL30_12740, partial [Candidatus Omnitrophica bacterium]|nr:hypothetical protein [Candidatus Omnitrophota bacterium]
AAAHEEGVKGEEEETEGSAEKKEESTGENAKGDEPEAGDASEESAEEEGSAETDGETGSSEEAEIKEQKEAEFFSGNLEEGDYTVGTICYDGRVEVTGKDGTMVDLMPGMSAEHSFAVDGAGKIA